MKNDSGSNRIPIYYFPFISGGAWWPQAPLSMRCPRQEYWSGFPFLSPKGLSESGIELVSLGWQADS